MIKFRYSGNFNHTEKLFDGIRKLKIQSILKSYASQGVTALAAATPKGTGRTAQLWDSEIATTAAGYTITWTNDSVNKGIPIVILIQYGHGTGNGGYVEGRDFINPAIRPILDKIAENLWMEVTKL